MLSTIVFAVAAFAAGVTGAWSPCGFSMVETLAGAAGREGAAGRRTIRAACATFAVGAVAGGALTFTALSALGALLGAGGTGALIAAAALACAAAAADAAGLRVAPQIRRQVPEPWRRTLPLPLAAALYGVLLGLGFTTFVLAFAVWALAGIAVTVGAPATGLAIGVAFGLGRALPVVAMAPRHDTLGQRLATRMAEEPRLLRRLRLADAALMAAAAVALLLGPAAASADAAAPAARVAAAPAGVAASAGAVASAGAAASASAASAGAASAGAASAGAASAGAASAGAASAGAASAGAASASPAASPGAAASAGPAASADAAALAGAAAPAPAGRADTSTLTRVAAWAGDPSTAGGALMWRAGAGRFVVREVDGARGELAARAAALGGPHLAVLRDDPATGSTVLDVTDRGTGAIVLTLATPGADAVAVSGEWIVWRAPGTSGRGDELLAAALPLPGAPASPANPVRIAGVRGAAAIGRPALDGDRVAFAVASPRGSRIVVHDIGAVTRQLVLSSRRTELSQPALLGDRLLYVEARTCDQRLQLAAIGADGRARGARTLARLGGLAWRDPGHEHGRTRQGSRPTGCPRGSPPRAKRLLWTTALDATAAYVTLLRPSASAAAARTTLARAAL